MPSPKRILITGVNGLVGSLAYRHLAGLGDDFVLFGMDRSAESSERVCEEDGVPPIPEDRFFVGDLNDFDRLAEVVGGMDVVVHLAAEPNGEAGWDEVLSNNIVGTKNLLEAARRAGVGRVVLASSIHVSNGWRKDEPYRSIVSDEFEGDAAEVRRIGASDPVRPVNFYGVSKICGEALGRMFSENYGISCICLRLGWVTKEDRPPSPADNSVFCSQRDVVQLIEKSILAAPSIEFDVFYGMSNNRQCWVDLAHARERIGYIPADAAEDMGA